jgi:hypothetical protein
MTTPTVGAVPSQAPQDLLFNAEKLDEAVNSSAHTYADRFGFPRKTLAGAIASISAITVRGAWTTLTAYSARDVVSQSGTWYVCLLAHTSGATFAGDLAIYWRVYQGVIAPELADDDGSTMVGFVAAGTGAVGRTAESKLRETITPSDYGTLAQAIAAAVSQGRAVRFDASATVRIPTDAATIQIAVDRCIAGRNGVVINLEIASGHKMTTGAIVKDGDFSCFEITSVDATVTLGTWPANTCVLEGRRATMPTWSILLDCEGKSVGGNDGYNLAAVAARENSDFYSTAGAGIINNGSLACANLMIARNSRCTTPEGVFTGAAYRNVWITHTSLGYMELCDMSGAGGANLFVSRASVCYGTGSNFDDSGEEGVLVYRSIFMAVPFVSTIPTFNNNGTFAILAQQASRVIVRDRSGYRPMVSNGAIGIRLEGGSRGDINAVDYDTLSGPALQLVGASMAQARDSTFTNIGGICLAADNGSHLDAASCTFDGVAELCQASAGTIILNNSDSIGAITGTAIYALNGGKVVAVSADFQNAGAHGISCENAEVIANGINVTNAATHCVRVVGGHVNVVGCSATSAGANGISATQGATVEAYNGNFSGAVTNGIAAQQGSRVSAVSANAQKGGSPGAGDVVIATGGIVAFSGGTGGLSTTANTVSAAGIIFQ